MTAGPKAASRSVVLGLDFGGTKIAIAVSDLQGARLGATTVDARPQDGAEAGLARGIAAAHELLRTATPGAALAAVGACTFGIPSDEGVELAPNIPGWGTLAFGRELRAAFPGVPVRMLTDVKAAARAELTWGALVGADPALYVNLGTGFAVALVVGGTVINGSRGAAGEIGYNLREPADVGVGLGRRTTLEDVVSGQAVARAAYEGYGRPMTAAETFRLAAAGPAAEPVACELVDRFVRELSMHVVNLTIALDPARIAVGGGMVRSWAQIEPGLRAALDAGVPYPPELVLAKFPYDAPLIGALALGVRSASWAERGAASTSPSGTGPETRSPRADLRHEQ